MSQKQYRISKNEGRAMLLFGIFFDLLPILALLVGGAFIFQAVTNNGVIGGAISGAQKNQTYHEKALEEANKKEYKEWWHFMYNSQLWQERFNAKSNIKTDKAITTTAVATGLFLSGTATIVAGPFIYMIMSFVGAFIAYTLFTLWFLMRKINIWSLSKPTRLLTTILSTIPESIPIINILVPGITVMVWSHIKVSRIEDAKKLAEAQASVLNRGSRIPRWQRVQQA